MDDWLVFRFLLLTVLLFLSACFSAAEVAFFSLTRVQVELLREKHGGAGTRVASLLAKPRRLLVTIYIGNEVVNVAVSAVNTMLALHYFHDYGIAVAVGLSSFMLLIFGEITPKSFALKYAEEYALFASRWLLLFAKAVYPVQTVITWGINRFLAATGAGAPERDRITEEELKTMLNHGEDKGVIESDEKEMIMNVFELGDTPVTEVMTPRTEIFALPLDEELPSLIRRAKLSNYSRIPVYRRDVDHIQGVVYAKDLLAPELETKITSITELLREPYFIPSTKRVDELLREFRKNKIHLAVILDEYGGVEGIVTLEDILEEVIGEPPEQKGMDKIVRLDTGDCLVPARLSLEDFNDYFKTSLEHEETHTVGGLVFHLFGRIPRWGESVTTDGVAFTVRRLKGKAIWQLLVRVGKQAVPDESKPMEGAD